jgi:stage III sporulation protein AH
MLSLVVVLSVYYVTTPDGQKSNMVNSAVDQMTKDKDTAEQEDTSVKTVGDEQFAQLRLDLEDKRNEAKEQLQEVMTAASTSAEEKSKAMDRLQEMNDLEAKEALLETLIKSEGYKEALVRADGNEVRITVKADKHSAKTANKIIQLVKGEIGPKLVTVKFDPSK